MNDLKQYIANVIKNVPALITQDEGLLLFSLPKAIPEQGVIVEIGSYKGGSTVLLAKASILAGKGQVYVIDPHVRERSFTVTIGSDGQKEFFPLSTWTIFKKNIEEYKVGSHIVPLVMTSAQAAKNWNKPISLLWIDGDHSYDSVRKDFLLWEKHLIEGGTIAFHDSNGSADLAYLEGPRAIVKKYIINSDRFTDVKVVDSITYAKKVKKSNILQALYNKLMVLIIDFNFDRKVGQLGLLLKKYSPWLYRVLKSLKGQKK